ncbi:hypothetical protein CDD81_1597 [Ophiocordyceps australis]|uniref:NACHT domain-containing protein n=1 Tax=Ophiocordyceps australis TaxID=1399860 RepID=A0A2C5XVM9_9HYPO|nr:hypothetical protein CDD81_1597 [Ophiocordyceps australis]
MAETPLRTKTRDSMPQRPLGRVGVTQVYPQVGQDLETNVDIFAIHGLDTTSPETWTFKYDEVVNRLLKGKRKRSRSEDGQQEKDVNWLTSPDMLPHDIPKARIFTCNWPSQLYHDPDTIEMTISELSRILFSDIQSERCQLGASKHRPVIFIASSLGGIILAKAFILAAEPKSDYEDLRAATAGVIFLGTPFRGTALADLFGVAMMSLEAKGFFRRQALARGLLDNLGKSTANLEELVNHFTTRCCLNSKVFIYCFYETVQSDLVAKALPKQTPDWLKKSLAQPKLLVDSSSARLDIAKESIPLQVAHVMMNKFPGPEDAHYRRVRGKIQESVQHALKLRDQALGFTGEDGRCWKILTEKIPSAGHEMQTIEDRKEPLIASCSNWILERFDWKRWRDTLVVHLEGGPGTGKTMTMMHLVNHHLSDQCHRDVAYFFFQGESKNECAFYRGLIYHLIRNSRNDDLISHLSQGLARSSDNAIDEAVALREILKRMLSEVKQSLLFVDGLDECQDRQDLKHVLSFIIATATDLDTKWVISSRVDFTITQSLEFASKRCKVNSICLATELTGASVSEYIQHKVTSLAKTKSYSSELQQNVQSILQARSEGIFLWVSLVCEVLQDDNESWNDEEVLDLLRMLPQGLPEIYKHILAKLRGLARRWNDCAAVLATVVTAERPLHLAELALLTHPDKKLQKEHAKKCVELCSNFLILQTDVVYFFHQSAKDFLLELLEKPTDEIFPHEICDRNRTILLASLRSMKDLKEDMYGLKDPAVDIDDIKEPPLGDPLLPLTYSCESWAYHLVAAFPDLKPCSTCPQMLNSLEEVFNFMSRSLLYWMEALCLKRLLYKGVASIRMLERFSSQSESRKLYALVHDATRFILKSMPIIESTPLQIYSSALLFAPETSIVRKLFLRKDYPVKVTLGLDQSWDQTLQIFEGPSPVRKVAVSSSGNRMASAYFDGTVKVWDAATGRVELEYRVSSEFVTDLAFSPDESKLASSNGPETGIDGGDIRGCPNLERRNRPDCGVLGCSLVYIL